MCIVKYFLTGLQHYRGVVSSLQKYLTYWIYWDFFGKNYLKFNEVVFHLIIILHSWIILLLRCTIGVIRSQTALLSGFSRNIHRLCLLVVCWCISILRLTRTNNFSAVNWLCQFLHPLECRHTNSMKGNCLDPITRYWTWVPYWMYGILVYVWFISFWAFQLQQLSFVV